MYHICNFKNHTILQNQRIHPRNHFYDFPPKMTISACKWKFLNFFGIRLTVSSILYKRYFWEISKFSNSSRNSHFWVKFKKKIQQKNSRNSFYRDLNIDQPKLRNPDAGQSKVFQLMNHFKVIYGAVWCRADIWTLVKLPFISMFYQKHCYHHFHDWRFKKYTHLIHWSLLLWHFSTVPCFYVSIKSKP